MYSVLQQTRTPLRDERGAAVFRRLYLCDREADMEVLPAYDAPGSAAVVAEGGGQYLLDHAHRWCRADGILSMGGDVWNG